MAKYKAPLKATLGKKNDFTSRNPLSSGASAGRLINIPSPSTKVYIPNGSARDQNTYSGIAPRTSDSYLVKSHAAREPISAQPANIASYDGANQPSRIGRSSYQRTPLNQISNNASIIETNRDNYASSCNRNYTGKVCHICGRRH